MQRRVYTQSGNTLNGLEFVKICGAIFEAYGIIVQYEQNCDMDIDMVLINGNGSKVAIEVKCYITRKPSIALLANAAIRAKRTVCACDIYKQALIIGMSIDKGLKKH